MLSESWDEGVDTTLWVRERIVATSKENESCISSGGSRYTAVVDFGLGFYSGSSCAGWRA